MVFSESIVKGIRMYEHSKTRVSHFPSVLQSDQMLQYSIIHQHNPYARLD